jgi:pSer/pThr/pTyr-binding forkhead associated (FHA) protein
VPESLLAILKLCALALLYLFFLRVVRAVWAEVTPARAAGGGSAPPAPRAPRPARRRATKRGTGALVVVEPRERKGQRYSIAEEMTLGRAAGCAISLDDNYTSQLHARLFQRDGQLHVEDLGSTNGTYVNGKKVTAPIAVSRGDRVKVGATVFEVSG